LSRCGQFADRRFAAPRAFDDLLGDALAHRMILALGGFLANAIQGDIHPGERTRIEYPLWQHWCLLYSKNSHDEERDADSHKDNQSSQNNHETRALERGHLPFPVEATEWRRELAQSLTHDNADEILKF
jgi:hypothetical protein